MIFVQSEGVSWEDADVADVLTCVENPTYGYWDEYYDELETGRSYGENRWVRLSWANNDRPLPWSYIGDGQYRVLRVPIGTPASRAGLIAGDIITALHNGPLEREVHATVRRNNKSIDLSVVLSEAEALPTRSDIELRLLRAIGAIG